MLGKLEQGDDLRFVNRLHDGTRNHVIEPGIGGKGYPIDEPVADAFRRQDMQELFFQSGIKVGQFRKIKNPSARTEGLRLSQ